MSLHFKQLCTATALSAMYILYKSASTHSYANVLYFTLISKLAHFIILVDKCIQYKFQTIPVTLQDWTEAMNK